MELGLGLVTGHHRILTIKRQEHSHSLLFLWDIYVSKAPPVSLSSFTSYCLSSSPIPRVIHIFFLFFFFHFFCLILIPWTSVGDRFSERQILFPVDMEFCFCEAPVFKDTLYVQCLVTKEFLVNYSFTVEFPVIYIYKFLVRWQNGNLLGLKKKLTLAFVCGQWIFWHSLLESLRMTSRVVSLRW